MAAPSLRVTRRPKGSPAAKRRSLTAASQPVDPQKSARTAVGTVGRADWQAECWDMLNSVGELRYYVGWRAGSCSRVRLIASEVDESTGLPTGSLEEDADGNPVGDGKRVAEIVKAIAGGPNGHSQMLKRAAECLTVPGEHWLAILVRNVDGEATEQWFVLTRDEWKRNGADEVEIELPDGEKHKYAPGVDRFFRIWNPHARRAKEADSPVRACLDPLREIVRTTKKIKVADKSRLIGNGVVFLPAEMSLPAGQQPVPEGQADVPGAPVPIVQGVPAADQLANLLFQTATASVEDEDSQAAVIPLLATVPGEHLGKIMHLRINDEVSKVEIEKRNDAIARLALGLDVSPERLLGIGGEANHWSAWQIGDEDVQLHIKPVIETLVHAINEQVIKPVLKREGIDPGKYVLWYDASGLTADPDLTDEANQARALGALRNEVYLRALGLPEDGGHDLTTLEGAQAWAREAIIQDPTLITTLAPLLDGELAAIEWPTPQPALPPGAEDGTDDDEDADEGTGSEPDTEDDAESAASLALPSQAELILAERMLVNRALDLAGKRRVNVRDTALKARLAGMAAHDYHRVMGPVNDSDIPRLISGWDAVLADSAIAMLGLDTHALRTAALTQIHRELTRTVIDVEAS